VKGSLQPVLLHQPHQFPTNPEAEIITPPPTLFEEPCPPFCFFTRPPTPPVASIPTNPEAEIILNEFCGNQSDDDRDGTIDEEECIPTPTSSGESEEEIVTPTPSPTPPPLAHIGLLINSC
jgi:hypothetical protein